MGSRFVRADTATLDISNHDWLLVKRRLTAGETREQLRRSYRYTDDGRHVFDPIDSAMALVTVYLVDWSLRGDDGKPVVIRELDTAALTATLDALDIDDFNEIRRAIEAHERAMDHERAEEKKLRAGEMASSPTSTSPATLAVPMSG